MKCLVCANDLLEAVVATTALGGPQICGPCIDNGKREKIHTHIVPALVYLVMESDSREEAAVQLGAIAGHGLVWDGRLPKHFHDNGVRDVVVTFSTSHEVTGVPAAGHVYDPRQPREI